MKIEINEEVLKELEYIVKLHKENSAPNNFESVKDIVDYVLASIADGSRRPGSWERGVLEQMGLIADCPEHYQYRSHYGE